MSLLWITENYYPDIGGMAESCDRIVYHLRVSGVKIDVVHLTEKKSRSEEVIKNNGIDIIFPISPDREHSLNLLTLYLEKFILNREILAIVAFGGMLPVLVSPVLSKIFQKKLILFLRGNDFDISLFSPRKREVLFYALENSCITFLNSKSKIRKIQLLKPNTNCVFLPNGLDMEAWFPSEKDKKEAFKIKKEFKGRKIIGIFGQLKAKKGISFFLDVFPEEEIENCAFLLAGEVYPEVMNVLEKKKFEYKIYPFQSRMELIKFYLSCDGVAIPSFYEGMPNVLLEVSSLGIPCLGSRIDGILDFFESIEENFLFLPMDKLSLRISIKKFLSFDEKQIEDHSRLLINEVKGKYKPSDERNTIIKNLMELNIL